MRLKKADKLAQEAVNTIQKYCDKTECSDKTCAIYKWCRNTFACNPYKYLGEYKDGKFFFTYEKYASDFHWGLK